MPGGITDSGELPPRVRFAKREILRLITALEQADPEQISLGMRTLQLEDMLADSREDAAHWRREYEAMKLLLLGGEGA